MVYEVVTYMKYSYLGLFSLRVVFNCRVKQETVEEPIANLCKPPSHIHTHIYII
jgi:hypothetical protein